MDEERLTGNAEGKSVEKSRDVLQKILSDYCLPSFGSMSKHDIDLLMFDAMISLGVFQSPLSIYDVMRKLKVTRSKARNLIYEHQLRAIEIENEEQLLVELRAILQRPLLSRKSDNVCIEIENPYMVDFIRCKLKDIGHITDGSFNPELVKMSTTAFSDLYFVYMDVADKDELNKIIVELNVVDDTSPKALLLRLLKEVASKSVGDAFVKIGEDVAKSCLKTLRDKIKEPGFDIKVFLGIK